MQLVDAGMIAFAAWHALKRRVKYPLTRQVPRMLRKLLQETEDTYTLFWNAEKLWKRERWPAYRDRLEIWDEAGREDFDAMIEVLTGLGVVQYRADGREADELLAAMAHDLEGSEPIVIRSDDKDFMQLLSPSTAMQGRVRGTVQYTDTERILGVSPEYVLDYLALAGDKADGIPPIFTPSRAKSLVATFGHVRGWMDRPLPEHPGVAEKVAEMRDQLLINLELVDLSANAVGKPPPPVLEGWGDLDRVRAIGERLEIKYLSGDKVADELAVLREWGARTRERLDM